MKCPSANEWHLLAMEALEPGPAEHLRAHARTCGPCRERFQSARREHTDRVRMYEAFDRDHDELREQLMAVLPEEAPQPGRNDWVARSRRRLGDFAMSMNQSVGRRAAALLVPAACIVIAVAIFLLPKQNAFAAAIEQMRRAQTIVTRFQMFLNDAEQPMTRGTLYLSDACGMRFDMNVGTGFGPLAGQAAPTDPDALASMTIYREPDGPMVMLHPQLNLVLRMHGVDQFTDDPRQTSPDAFIRKFLEMTGDADILLGRSTIDGHKVEGFEVSGQKLGLEFVGSGMASHTPAGSQDAPSQIAARLWVDLDTNLPVRMEVEMNIQLIGGRMLAVYDEFEWDKPLDAALFTQEIPEGMREVDITIPPMTEETLLDGLRMYAEVAGRYPMSIDPTSISTQFVIAAMSSGRIVIDPADPASTMAGGLMDDSMKLSVACAFVQKLAADGHEPEYFGDIVTPEDADDVLLHWRLDDGQVRVIYGDLRAATVPTAD